MLEKINEKIAVICKYDPYKRVVMPVKMRWQGREYRLEKLAYHHLLRSGRTLQHIFHVTDGLIDFRLRLDTESLIWTLEEVSDDSTSQ